MNPILYDTNETEFTSNGLGRLRDCMSCVVTEERNGIYECDFEYPITGAHYDEITVGRIIGVTHSDKTKSNPMRFYGSLTDEENDTITDENDLSLTVWRDGTVLDYDIQPFDIVSYSKPIDGVVSFHCTHISYRQSYMTLVATNINRLVDAFSAFSDAVPSNPFGYWTNKPSAGYLGCADGIPHSVRSMLGGVEGSILDAYGGEYEWDKWTVKLWASRGQVRDFTIRYGVNMLDYNEEFDTQGTYSSCIPFWTDGTTTKVGDRVFSNGTTITGRGECVPLDMSDKFETQPTEAELRQAAQAYMNGNNTFTPIQNIHVEFARLQDLGEFENYQSLLECNLCDVITVAFPDYNGSAQYKIVKTVWDVLRDRYESMELGDLSPSLAEALGVSSEQQAKNNILNSIYPIGSIYISTNAASPGDLFGGTWQQIQGRFLLSADSNHLAGSTGGEETHTLTTNEIPAHTHTNTSVYVNAAGDGTSIMTEAGGSYGTAFDYAYDTSSVGGDAAHNNMPPYLTVYMWERTA